MKEINKAQKSIIMTVWLTIQYLQMAVDNILVAEGNNNCVHFK